MQKATAHVRIEVHADDGQYAKTVAMTHLQMRQRDKLEATVVEILQEAGLTNISAISCLTGEPVYVQPTYSASNLKTAHASHITIVSEKAIRSMIDDALRYGAAEPLYDEVMYHDGVDE